MHYSVVVASFRLNAAEPPGKVLERVLGVGPDQARALLRHFPAVVASQVDVGRAHEVVALLEAAGAKAEVCESPVLVNGPSDFPAMPSIPIPPAPQPLREEPARPTPSLASLPPLGSAPLDQTPESPPEEERPSGQRLRPMTVYQLGDLDLGGSAKPPPAAKPVRAVLVAPVEELPSEPAPSESGLELELAPVRPMAAAKPVSGQAVRAGQPAVATKPTTGAKPVAAAKPAGAQTGGAPSSDGMQSFGDGFDDMETELAPKLELDRQDRWHDDKVVGLHKAKIALETSGARPAAARRPVRTTHRGSFFDEWGDSILGFVKYVLGLTAVLLVALAIVSYIRDPEAMEELCGLMPPPPMEDLVEGVMQEGVKLSAPGPSTEGKDASGTLGDVNLTVSTADAPLHPLLRLAPNVARVFVAARLRGFVSDVEGIELKGLSVPPGLGLHVDCMLVVHHLRDLRDREAATRVEALLRTGYALDLPEGGQRLLAKQIEIARAKAGPKSRFTPVCLAL